MAAETTQVQGATIVAETQLAKEMKAKTDAAFKAVQQAPPGIDSDAFGEELQAAIDRDLGKTKEPPPPAPAPTPPPAPAPAPTAKPDPTQKPTESSDPIPAELFGTPPKTQTQEPPKPDQTDAERQKFVEEQTKGMSLNASERFKAAYKREEEATKKAKEFERKVAELEAANKKAVEELQAKLQAAAAPKELEDLKKKVTELDEQLEKRALLDHPKFKAAFDNKIEAWIDVAKKYVGQEKAGEVAALLRLPDSTDRNNKIDELAEGIEASLTKTKFLNLVNEIDKVAADREEKVIQWKENKRLLDEQEARERAKIQEQNGHRHRQSVEQLNAVWNDTAQRLTAKESELEWYQKIEGNENWNKEVDNRLRHVRALAEEDMPPDKMYELSALALAAPMFRRMFLEERSRTMKLASEIEALKGAQPNPGAGGGVSGEDGGVSEDDDYITAAERQLVKRGDLR